MSLIWTHTGILQTRIIQVTSASITIHLCHTRLWGLFFAAVYFLEGTAGVVYALICCFDCYVCLFSNAVDPSKGTHPRFPFFTGASKKRWRAWYLRGEVYITDEPVRGRRPCRPILQFQIWDYIIGRFYIHALHSVSSTSWPARQPSLRTLGGDLPPRQPIPPRFLWNLWIDKKKIHSGIPTIWIRESAISVNYERGRKLGSIQIFFPNANGPELFTIRIGHL